VLRRKWEEMIHVHVVVEKNIRIVTAGLLENKNDFTIR
jgi:hypothetical protein